jgi:hypothetical protein
MPLLLGILIYGLFVISQGLLVVLFGRLVTISGLLTLTFPMVPVSWVKIDYFALAIAFPLVPAQFLILILTVNKLARVVAANAR